MISISGPCAKYFINYTVYANVSTIYINMVAMITQMIINVYGII